ncbi:chorismate synthase [Candidatus Aerophobetes bacterium]|nr:chorismate synthase [Candidatus Aerophobetes bacterium]
MSTILRYLTCGESHGQGLLVILEGIPSGLKLERDYINRDLMRRQTGYGRGERMQIERDRVRIISGLRWGKTLGSPISLFIPNLDWKNWQKLMSPEGSRKKDTADIPLFTRPRPGHADLVGGIKYNFLDLRNVLERASARETAARVAAGAVCRRLLEEFGISIFSRVIQIGGEKDESSWKDVLDNYERIENSPLRCMDEIVEKKMIELINKAKQRGDTLGGIFEVIALGLPPGLGSYVQWDLKLDARLAFGIMSIQAIIGVEIGMGFKGALHFGSEVQDEIAYDKERGFYRLSNRCGGIEGGMSTGEPLVIRAAMKPISTLAKPLRSVDILSKKQVKAAKERADVCAVPAASVIGEAVVAIEIARAMREKFGGDSLEEMRRNYLSYMKYVRER